MHYHHIRSATKSGHGKYRDTIAMTPAEAGELAWIERDEIRYKGRMFDVKLQLAKAGNVLLIGHYDLEDDILISLLSGFFGEGNEGSDTVAKPMALEAILPGIYLSRCHLVLHTASDRPEFSPSRYRSSGGKCSFQPPRLSWIYKV